MRMQNKIKDTNNTQESNTNEIKKLLVLVLTVTVIFFIFYGITTLVLNKDKTKENEIEKVNIDLEKILISQILVQPENNYYVLITIEKDANNGTYESLKEEYYKKDNHKKIYSANLNDPMNKTFIGDELSLQGNVKNYKFSKSTLLEIENASIKSITEGSQDILEKLNNME